MSVDIVSLTKYTCSLSEVQDSNNFNLIFETPNCCYILRNEILWSVKGIPNIKENCTVQATAIHTGISGMLTRLNKCQ